MNNSKKQPEPINFTATGAVIEIPEYLDTKEVMRRLGIGRETLRKLIYSPYHPLPAYRLGENGQRLRFRTSEFIQWCKEEEARHKL